MSTWSKIVIELNKEGYTPDEIVERISLPLVTREYVDNALAQRKAFARHRWQIKRFQKTVPSEGTITRKVYDLVQELGGNSALLELLKNKSQFVIAKEWNVSRDAIHNYIRDFITGSNRIADYQGNFYSVPQMLERKALIAEVRKQPGTIRTKKRMSIKDVRNLW